MASGLEGLLLVGDQYFEEEERRGENA